MHQARDYRRWRSVRQLWTSAPMPDEPRDPAAAPTGDPALRRRIGKALERLTARQREAFVLVHLEGLTVRECAEVLGKPLGTVKSHLQRALVSLRSELADLWEESHDD